MRCCSQATAPQGVSGGQVLLDFHSRGRLAGQVTQASTSSLISGLTDRDGKYELDELEEDGNAARAAQYPRSGQSASQPQALPSTTHPAAASRSSSSVTGQAGSKWTAREEDILRQCMQRYGNNWSEVFKAYASAVPGHSRTFGALKQACLRAASRRQELEDNSQAATSPSPHRQHRVTSAAQHSSSSISAPHQLGRIAAQEQQSSGSQDQGSAGGHSSVAGPSGQSACQGPNTSTQLSIPSPQNTGNAYASTTATDRFRARVRKIPYGWRFECMLPNTTLCIFSADDWEPIQPAIEQIVPRSREASAAFVISVKTDGSLLVLVTPSGTHYRSAYVDANGETVSRELRLSGQRRPVGNDHRWEAPGPFHVEVSEPL